MDKGAPASRLVEEQLTAFQENFGAEDVSRAKALGVTPYELLTVASMVEREAQVPGDRAKIAAVIYNRLQSRACRSASTRRSTTRSSCEQNIPTYTQELTESQLQIDSPYNTRTHTGLPPTPISNPGTASIQAAAHPAHASYLYYVAGADGCGEQVFSDTQAAVRSERRRLRRSEAKERRQAADLQEELMSRLGVLGWPVAHSRSPAMHNAALAALGMRRLALPAPARAAGAARARPCARSRGAGFLGANVTIPHKQAALALATRPAPPRARSARRTRSASPPTARSRRRTPTRPG